MARYKKENNHRYAKTICQRCKKEVTRRASFAVVLNPNQDAQYILARDSNKQAITRKALPRIHRDKCPD